MQVSIRVTHSPGHTSIGLVAFEFGPVKHPHEILQDESRWRRWDFATNEAEIETAEAEMFSALTDKHRGLLGRRGSAWISMQHLNLLRITFDGDSEPWEESQILCPSTLLWAAKRVPGTNFRVPPAPGLIAGDVLHEAVQQAVLLQSAFRALSLNKDVPEKSRV